MSKKSFGKFLALAAVVGTAAAAVSYFVRYRSFSRELDEDFHDFEGEDDAFDEEPAPHRNYVTLPKVEEALKEATGQAVEKAKNAASIVRETVKSAAEKTRGAGREAAEEAAGTAAEEPVPDSGEEFDLFAGQSGETQDTDVQADEETQDADVQADGETQVTEDADGETQDADKTRTDSASGATIVDDEQ